jgi:pimeloyl-ACP methyl ester carboxylesterase
MKMRLSICKIVLTVVFFSSNDITVQEPKRHQDQDSRILSSGQLEKLMDQPACLKGYRSNQSGPLTRLDKKEGERDDSTFTVEEMKISSSGFLIKGWLYLPKKDGQFPLVILTNGGGDDSRRTKSLSDWIAPILAHCGFAAFVHDKRGTGLSEGIFVKTTYNDYITDAGNCGKFLSHHKRINPDLIGVAGGSEGGRIAVIAASRFPVFSFVVSFAGTVVSMEDDRLYAQMGSYRSAGISDSLINTVTPLWKRSFRAWASNDLNEHAKVNKEISEWRKKYSRDILPYMKEEMDSIPEFRSVLSTWNSLSEDYLTELGRFNKKWLAIFGEVDKVVPTQASISNILYYMDISGNKSYNIAVIPKCGHAPVDIETKRLIHIDHLIINWLNENVSNYCKN